MRRAAWIKSGGAFLLCAFGGPALIRYVQPSEEELFKRYNPELQKRSLEGRDERLKEANAFIDQLKEYSKDPRPIWTVWKEDAMKKEKIRQEQEKAIKMERKGIAEEIRRQRMEGDK